MAVVARVILKNTRKILIFKEEKISDFLSLSYYQDTHGFLKKLSQFGPAVWPAIANIYKHSCERRA